MIGAGDTVTRAPSQTRELAQHGGMASNAALA
jgi:hypothetical protein